MSFYYEHLVNLWESGNIESLIEKFSLYKEEGVLTKEEITEFQKKSSTRIIVKRGNRYNF